MRILALVAALVIAGLAPAVVLAQAPGASGDSGNQGNGGGVASPGIGGGDGGIVKSLVAAPEPTMLVVTVAGLASAVWLRRRRPQ